MLLDRRGEFDRPDGRPVLTPRLLGSVQLVLAEIVVAVSSGQRCAHFGVSQPAGHGSVASVPQLGRELTAGLLGEQLHQCAGIEIDQRHWSAPIFADAVRQGPAWAWPDASGGGRALTGFGSAEHSLGRQPLQRCRGVQAHQPGDRHASVGDDDLMTATRLIER